MVDEAAVYNRSLGSNEIAAIYNAGPAGKTAAGPYFTTPPAFHGVGEWYKDFSQTSDEEVRALLSQATH